MKPVTVIGPFAIVIARIGAANFLGFVERENFRQIVARIVDRLFLFDLVVLGAALARGVALGAKAPAIALGNHLAALIVKFAAIDLLDRAASETGLMLDQLLEPRLGRELVAKQHRAMPHGIDAGEHRVHARQAANVAAERAVEREDE
jgi:hypothetical protein